jgi:hypothetical protein
VQAVHTRFAAESLRLSGDKPEAELWIYPGISRYPLTGRAKVVFAFKYFL